jgi:hypothetical protein
MTPEVVIFGAVAFGTLLAIAAAATIDARFE